MGTDWTKNLTPMKHKQLLMPSLRTRVLLQFARLSNYGAEAGTTSEGRGTVEARPLIATELLSLCRVTTLLLPALLPSPYELAKSW
jgi:hypothetical protein